MATKIETRRRRIVAKLAKAHAELATLKEDCSALGHGGKLTGKYGANTGNWCSGDDSYWVDFDCPLCGKHWTEDQDEVWYDREGRVMRTKDGILFTKVGDR